MKLNDHQKKLLIFALVSNYAIYMCMYLFFYPTYESQLDIMMQAALYGVSGDASAYILYSNVIFGCILKPFITMLPGLNWYYFYLMAICVLLLSLITYIIVKRADNKIGRTVSFVISCFLGYECYVLPGAMKTAGVTAVALLLVVADAYETGGLVRRTRKIMVLFMAAVGSMTQLSAFLVTCLIGGIALVCYYVIRYSAGKSDAQDERNASNKPVVSLKIVGKIVGYILVVVVLLYTVDDFSYRMTGRETAVTYRGTMCKMYGYGMGEYDADIAGQSGIDESGFHAMKTGNFVFQNESTLDHIRSLVWKSNKVSFEKTDKYFKRVPLGLFKFGIFYLFIIMEFMLFYSRIKNKKLLVWMEIGLLIAVTLLEYLFNAWGYNQVAVITIFALILPLILALEDAKEVEYQYLWVYLAVFSVILYSKFSSSMVSSVADEDMYEKFTSVDTSKCNIIDLNVYLKRFSAQHYYAPRLLQQSPVKITNGAYYLMDGYADKMLNGVDDGITYEWMYNPYNLDIWAVLLD